MAVTETALGADCRTEPTVGEVDANELASAGCAPSDKEAMTSRLRALIRENVFTTSPYWRLVRAPRSAGDSIRSYPLTSLHLDPCQPINMPARNVATPLNWFSHSPTPPPRSVQSVAERSARSTQMWESSLKVAASTRPTLAHRVLASNLATRL